MGSHPSESSIAIRIIRIIHPSESSILEKFGEEVGVKVDNLEWLNIFLIWPQASLPKKNDFKPLVS